MNDIKKQQQAIIADIFENLHYKNWQRATGKYVSDIPPDIMCVYHRFHIIKGEATLTGLVNDEELLAELKEIHNKLEDFLRNV